MCVVTKCTDAGIRVKERVRDAVPKTNNMVELK